MALVYEFTIPSEAAASRLVLTATDNRMSVFRANGLDDLLQSRLAEDNHSPLRRRYSQSPSFPFFLLSSAHAFLHHRLPSQWPRPSVDQRRIRLVCVSDTHNHLIPHSAIPDGDVFIHAGDLTESGTVSELSYTLDWMRSLPHTHKIFIAGNHDAALASREERDSLDFTGLTYLCDQAVELTIRGRKLQVFGSPYTPRFGNFAFQYLPNHAGKQWEKMPRETDVLITHGPPKAHLDHYGLGCNALLEAVWKVRPAVMVCGHIHEGRGVETLDWDNAQKKWEGVIRARKVVGWWEMITTHGNSPASSTSSLSEPAPYASPSQPRLEGYDSSRTLISDQDRDSKAGLKLTDPWYTPYDPYTPHNGHDAGDSIPLVAVSSANQAPDQRPRSVHVVPPSRPRGWRGRFEPVPIVPLLVHALLCFAAFPTVYLVSRAASGLSLFWTRLIVGGLCGGVGLTLGVSLLDLSRSSIEAALWATIIHESLKGEINEELDYHTANPLSPWAAMLLLYRRYLKRISSRHRKEVRRHEDGTPWWLCIVLFLATATIAASLVFVLGRVVDIYTVQQTQTKEYYEATVVGDVTPEEIARATSVLNDTLSQVRYTWTMTPLSSAAHVPTDRYFNLNRTIQKGNTVTTTTDTIHFAETFASQLAPPEAHPSGFGTYLNQTQVAGLGAPDLTHTAGAGAGPTTKAVGQIVRWPRWGSRIGCQIIENLERYLTPHSRPANMTYLFVPRTAVDNVFEYMGLPPPNSSVFPPANFTKFMEPGDTPNVTATENEIAFMSKWWDNGVAHQFNWFPVSRGEDGNGWLAIEIVMVRLNQSYTAENSTFQVYGELGEGRTRIGFDAAICLEEVKGYVVDAYNNTAGSPVSLSLQYFGSNLNTSAQSLNQASSKQPERIGEPLSIPAQRGITSEGKWMVYNAAHYNARNIMLKDNGRDWWFVPNPTVVAFGGGITPTEYIQLNADQIAKVLSNSDSQHLLPYLVGTQPVVAHVYPDKTVAYTQIYTTWLAVVLAVVLLNGIIVSALVPRLPLGVSRKDIGVSSWLAAIEDDPSAKAHLSPVANRRFERLTRRVTRWGSGSGGR